MFLVSAWHCPNESYLNSRLEAKESPTGGGKGGIKGCTAKRKNEISAPMIFISKGNSVIAVLGSSFSRKEIPRMGCIGGQ